ncbi:MAG: FTR1 family protein [Bowdeniella nasicola]|nr:FTR1 family protein [Bowdeniella nasicola]
MAGAPGSWARTLGILAIFTFLLAGLTTVVAPGAHAAPADEGEWTAIADDVATQLNDARDAAANGDTETALDLVKKARYELFAGKGLEEQIASQISGADASKADMDFGLLAQAIKKGETADVEKYVETLTTQLSQDAAELDGGGVAADDMKISPGKWGQTATTMIGLLDQALETYNGGDPQGGKDLVNEAYYGHYETTGFEKMTMARVSGGRVATVELEFALIKKAMNEGKDDEVATRIAELKPYLIEDANTLDGFDGTGEGKVAPASGWTIFFASLMVILREGIEAMLVVAAVIAYLVKAGHKDKTKVVWAGAAAAIVISILLAIAIKQLTGLAGKSQELIEGITALVAVAMLVYVSNWMLGKSDAAAWDKFIKDKTDTSLSRGSLLSLAFVAFLAVVREGAETILFYQPILAMADDDTSMVWLGLGLGLVILVIVYALIRILSLRIPLRPFFLATSLLLALMALTFTGSGIGELQEADVISVTPIEGFPTIDLLGIYPQVENLTAQALVLALMIALFIFGYRRQRRAREAQ